MYFGTLCIRFACDFVDFLFFFFKGKFSLKFTKKNYAEFFQGLEMITSLLTPKGEKTAKLPLIEVISSK